MQLALLYFDIMFLASTCLATLVIRGKVAGSLCPTPLAFDNIFPVYIMQIAMFTCGFFFP